MTQVPSKQPFQTLQGSIIVIQNLSGVYQRTKQYYYGRNVTASPEISPWNQEISSKRVKSVNTCWNSLSGNGSKTELKMVPSQQDSGPLSRTSEVTKCQNVQGHLGHIAIVFMKSSLNGSPRHLPMPVWVLYGSINFKDTRQCWTIAITFASRHLLDRTPLILVARAASHSLGTCSKS